MTYSKWANITTTRTVTVKCAPMVALHPEGLTLTASRTPIRTFPPPGIAIKQRLLGTVRSLGRIQGRVFRLIFTRLRG
jgi:hypothetical protein